MFLALSLVGVVRTVEVGNSSMCKKGCKMRKSLSENDETRAGWQVGLKCSSGDGSQKG